MSKSASRTRYTKRRIEAATGTRQKV